MHVRISLHRFVDELTEGLVRLAVSRKSIIINQIDRELEVGSDENMLAYVLWNLLNRVVSSTQNESIHIQSVSTGDSTAIRVWQAASCVYRACSNAFAHEQCAAER